jgi:hypothetical protein
MPDPASMPTRSTYDKEVDEYAKDQATLTSQPAAAAKGANACLEGRSGWDEFLDFFRGLVDEIQAKITEFNTKVIEFLDTVVGLDQGDPYAIYAAGQAWLDAQRVFTGLDTSFQPWNLKALDGWEGSAGSTYAASVPVQASAVARLGSWCGSAGAVLMNHSRGVVEAFLQMRLTMADELYKIVNAVADLASLDPTKLGDKISKIVGFVSTIIMAVKTMETMFASWANESMRSIDAMKSAMADQTGTDGGAWPDFVHA